MNESNANNLRTQRAEMFRALLQDKRISHGAFRLFHALYDHINPKKGDNLVWPSFRRVKSMIGCRQESIATWIAELTAAGWLRTVHRRRGTHSIYELSKVLPKSVAPTAAEKSSTTAPIYVQSATEKRISPLRKSVAEVSLSDRNEVIGGAPRSGVVAAPPQTNGQVAPNYHETAIARAEAERTRPPTDEELIASARYLVELGKESLLTERQRSALASFKRGGKESL